MSELNQQSQNTEPHASAEANGLNRIRKSFFIRMLATLALLLGGCLLFGCEWQKGRPLRGRRNHRKKGPLRAAPDANPLDVAILHWQNMAREEHESIAAFSEIALDLMAAGAPLDLITRCHLAALDEARHTKLCISVLRSLEKQRQESAASVQQAALDAFDSEERIEIPALRAARRRPKWKTALLTRLAVESYMDGYIGEGSSATVLGQLSLEAEDPEMRNALKVLAREEMGHARLGEDIVSWCRAEGGVLIDSALEIARRRLDLNRINGDEVLHFRSYGVPDGALRHEALARRSDDGFFLKTSKNDSVIDQVG